MKFTVGLLAVYFLLLCVAPCPVSIFNDKHQACCSAASGTQGNNAPQQAPGEECYPCNPLSSCCSSGSFISFSQNISFLNSPGLKHFHIGYMEPNPSSVLVAIWQPPKIS